MRSCRELHLAVELERTIGRQGGLKKGMAGKGSRSLLASQVERVRHTGRGKKEVGREFLWLENCIGLGWHQMSRLLDDA